MASDSAVVIEATRWRYVAKFACAAVAGIVCWTVPLTNLVVPGITSLGDLLEYITGGIIFSAVSWYLYKDVKSPPRLTIDPNGFRVDTPRKTATWEYDDVTYIKVSGAQILIGSSHHSLFPNNSIDLEFPSGASRVGDALRTAMAKRAESEDDFRRSIWNALRGGEH